jgi:hypothetical protein
MITQEDILNRTRNGSGSYDGDFNRDVEEFFGMTDWPQSVKDSIHWKAYEDGHASGYHDVFNQYWDLIDLVKLVAEACGCAW